MKVQIISVIFLDLILKPYELPTLRGYFSKQFPEHTELHNHLPDGKFSYKFPKIQYRIISGHPALIGFNKGMEILKSIFLNLDEIIINNRKYMIHEKEIFVYEHDFGATDKFINYKFISPWMALKEENYEKYKTLDKIEQQRFLKHILRENLKTLSKGFNYTIPDIEEIKVEGFFKPKLVNFKNIRMLCFKGEFMVNFHIPDLLGLGKQSARGFGVISSPSLRDGLKK
ncbi:MAG: hypothetical protein KAT68_18355 [Bacteroidales bacterium]|nr:hypothetical protein [Bacteroidales bacterium]